MLILSMKWEVCKIVTRITPRASALNFEKKFCFWNYCFLMELKSIAIVEIPVQMWRIRIVCIDDATPILSRWSSFARLERACRIPVTPYLMPDSQCSMAHAYSCLPPPPLRHRSNTLTTLPLINLRSGR